MNRRAVLRTAGLLSGGVVLGACGGDEDDEPETPSPPTPSPTPELSPTPTQAVIASPVAGYTDPEKWSGRTLTFAGRAGDYQDAQEQAFFEPFAAATGVSIQIETADENRLQSQVDGESVSWDLVNFPMEDVLTLARDNYLEPIDYDVVDKSVLFPEIALQYGVGAAFFSTVIVFPAGTDDAPQDWVDFWDVPPPVDGDEPEPTTLRALRHSPVGTLEFALLADGVAIDELYPLDVDRAFASLDRIRHSVLVWYEDGKQPIELVVAGQVGNGERLERAAWQLRSPTLVRIQWYGGMLSADAWVVPRGAPNRDIAMDFINYATRAVPSANFGLLVPYGPGQHADRSA